MAVCLYGRHLAQQAPHTRLVALCDGLFRVTYITMPSSLCVLGAQIPGAKYAARIFTENDWLVINDLCGSQAIQRKQWRSNDYSACEIGDGVMQYEDSRQ